MSASVTGRGLNRAVHCWFASSASNGRIVSLTPHSFSDCGQPGRGSSVRTPARPAPPPAGWPFGRPAAADQFGVQRSGRRRVEADDVRQHDADRDAVRDAVVGRQRVGAAVADAEHRVLDRHAREVRADLHRRAGREVAGSRSTVSKFGSR